MLTVRSINARYLLYKNGYSISSTTIMILEKSLVKRHDIKPILAMPFFSFCSYNFIDSDPQFMHYLFNNTLDKPFYVLLRHLLSWVTETSYFGCLINL